MQSGQTIHDNTQTNSHNPSHERDIFFESALNELPLPLTTSISIEDIQNKIQTSIHQDANDITKIDCIIQNLALLHDTYCGIKSHYDKVNGHHVLIRDARDAKHFKKQEDNYTNWAAIGLAALKTAEKLIRIYKKPEETSYNNDLTSLMRTFLNNIQHTKDPKEELAIFVDTAIIPYLKKELPDIIKNKKTAQKKLNTAKSFTNFDRPNCSIVTLSKLTDRKNLIQIDIPIGGHIQSPFKEQYHLLATNENDDAIKKALSESSQDPRTMDWYFKQNNEIKELIRQNAKNILEGAMIPTQLRTYLPGLKNAGEERSYIVDSALNNPIFISHNYHSGTPAHLLKANNQEATYQNIEQTKALTKPAALLELTLLTPTFFREDRNLINQTKNACENSKVMHANLPVNFIRRFWKMDSTEIDALYEKAQQLTSQTNTSDKEVVKNKKKLALCIKLFEEKRHEWLHGLDLENCNLHMAALVLQMAHYMNEIEKKAHQYVVKISCQSGKDRTECVLPLATSYGVSIQEAIQQKSRFNPQLVQDTIKTIYASGHSQTKAALKGGDTGAWGIKKDSRSALSNSTLNEIDPTKNNTANYNKSLPTASRPWYKNKTFWLGAAALITGILLEATGIGAIAGWGLAAYATSALAGGTSGLISAEIVTVASIVIGGIVTISAMSVPLKRAIKENSRFIEKQEDVILEKYSVFPNEHTKPIQPGRKTSYTHFAEQGILPPHPRYSHHKDELTIEHSPNENEIDKPTTHFSSFVGKSKIDNASHPVSSTPNPNM